MKQSRKSWISWQFFGLVVCVILLFTLSFVEQRQDFDTVARWILRIVSALTAMLSLFFFAKYSHLRRKLKSQSANELLALDNRAPVLFLRPFADDLKFGRVYGGPSEEEQVAKALNEIGPFIAIGRPGQESSQSGAARMHVRTDEWQDRVDDLMTKAQLVVVRLGVTESLWWEIQLVFRKVRPERVVFLIPRDSKLYERFRQKANQFLPHELPEFNAGRLTSGWLKAILYFDPDWTPHVRKLKYFEDQAFMRSYSMTAALKEAMQPVVGRLRIDENLPTNYSVPRTP